MQEKILTENETVTLSKKEYSALIESSIWLRCLESAGVDNWDGISYAYELVEEIETQEKPRYQRK